jgi:hypothetical protein
MTTSINVWFVVGLVFLVLLAMYAPKFDGALIVLIGTFLALKIAQKGILN